MTSERKKVLDLTGADENPRWSRRVLLRLGGATTTAPIAAAPPRLVAGGGMLISLPLGERSATALATLAHRCTHAGRAPRGRQRR